MSRCRPFPTSPSGTPQLVFEGTYDLTAAGDLHYSADPDRRQFLMVIEESATTLRMVFDWLGEIDGGDDPQAQG